MITNVKPPVDPVVLIKRLCRTEMPIFTPENDSREILTQALMFDPAG